VADYMLSNAGDVLSKSLIVLSSEINVSEASIMRFCKQLGYSGFSELKLMLAMELGERAKLDISEAYDIHISKEDKYEDIPGKVTARTIKALEDTLKGFDITEYMKAIEAIASARRVQVFGVGNSSSIAHDILNKFIRLGIDCSMFFDTHIQLSSAANLGKGDVVIGISHSGRTKDTIDVLREAKNRGVVTICITNYNASQIIEVSDIKLLVAGYETGYFSETMVSRISQLAVVDMLYMGLLLHDYDRSTERIHEINKILADRAY
jgi:RpiR family transcriptional regulator, carbohydrate utilization regulator